MVKHLNLALLNLSHWIKYNLLGKPNSNCEVMGPWKVDDQNNELKYKQTFCYLNASGTSQHAVLPLATREWCGPVPSFDLAFRGGKTALLLFLFAEGGHRGGGSILTPLKVKFRCSLCNLDAAQKLLHILHHTKHIFSLYFLDGGMNSSLFVFCFCLVFIQWALLQWAWPTKVSTFILCLTTIKPI